MVRPLRLPRPLLALAAPCVLALGPAGVLVGPPELTAAPLAAQTRGGAPLGAVDSAALHMEARRAQARFERRRVPLLPATAPAGGGTSCDEHLGRMCLSFGGGSDWERPPEHERIGELRAELLEVLGRAGRTLPGDDWIVGQRVHYLGYEEGRWSEAEAAARACGGTRWWCDALLAYVLHRRGEPRAADSVAARALRTMPHDVRERWTDPEPLLDREAAGLYGELSDSGAAATRAFRDRLWTLADPLYLVPGNDRRTEHFARHVEARIRSEARNPYNLRWGWDLAELTLRYGSEYGWERERPRWNPHEATNVVGRFHPRSRGLLPPGAVIRDPAALEPGAWTVDEHRARSRHAPSYAPRIHALDPQVAVFRRGDSLLVVAAWEVPPSRDFEMDPLTSPPSEGYRSGLFLAGAPPLDSLVRGAAGGTELTGDTAASARRGHLATRAPAGRWLLSVETLHPGERRAWRARMGLVREPIPRGIVALSDLLLLEPGTAGPTLEEIIPRALPDARAPADRRLGLAWEVYGLTGLEGELRFRATVGRDDPGLLRRAGEWLRLVDPDPPVVVSWSEPAPDRPGPLLRTVDLDLSALGPGEYEIRLELDLRGRTPVTARRTVRVEPAGY